MVPVGTDDVTNFHILDVVRARLAHLRAAAAEPGRSTIAARVWTSQAARLEALLLTGAPSLQVGTQEHSTITACVQALTVVGVAVGGIGAWGFRGPPY